MKKEYILKSCFILGALFAAGGVILQAMATHLPADTLAQPRGREFLHSAADILLWHGIALCALSPLQGYLNPMRQLIACCLMSIGTLLFSIPVILLGLNMIQHAVSAPFGGSLLILSWLIMASAAFGKTNVFNKQK
ncbi:DUF423 domain-containing protein [Acetobacteraceae bacterium ESL0709]|nr:DUF423 domain-containing protein [Acetobacteraceae bacterium ESL0697]MDF7678424.1 DUF423 domain-containing protein [Acetobacteraceae bacterium ESL0709]